MTEYHNHYETLKVSPSATPEEIKQAYRRLVKLFHPDSNHELEDDREIIRINAAYEVLKDRQRRQNYDLQQRQSGRSDSDSASNDYSANRRAAGAQSSQHRQHRETARYADEHLHQWLTQVYQPVNRMLLTILNSLDQEVDQLSADPFDDDLLGAFQSYLHTCRSSLGRAEQSFRSMPNPSNVAGVAAHLYYCLDRLTDGIDELEFFTLNYDEHYLHNGQELFRIAAGLRQEAQAAMREVLR